MFGGQISCPSNNNASVINMLSLSQLIRFFHPVVKQTVETFENTEECNPLKSSIIPQPKGVNHR